MNSISELSEIEITQISGSAINWDLVGGVIDAAFISSAFGFAREAHGHFCTEDTNHPKTCALTNVVINEFGPFVTFVVIAPTIANLYKIVAALSPMTPRIKTPKPKKL